MKRTSALRAAPAPLWSTARQSMRSGIIYSGCVRNRRTMATTVFHQGSQTMGRSPGPNLWYQCCAAGHDGSQEQEGAAGTADKTPPRWRPPSPRSQPPAPPPTPPTMPARPPPARPRPHRPVQACNPVANHRNLLREETIRATIRDVSAIRQGAGVWGAGVWGRWPERVVHKLDIYILQPIRYAHVHAPYL